jgi:hypothetical protein
MVMISVRLLKALALACGVVTIPAMTAGLAGQDAGTPRPPTSIEHDGERALVAFSHQRRLVTRCTRVSAPAIHCDPATRELPARAVLALTPVPDGRALTRSDTRKVVRLTLGGTEPSTASLRLGLGAWDLQWPESSLAARMRVRSRDDFAVVLHSTEGACLLENGKCRLATASIERAIEIPSEHRESP